MLMPEFVSTGPICTMIFKMKSSNALCATHTPQRTFDTTSCPKMSLEKVGVDHFTLDGKDFLLIVDYYSKYPEVLQVPNKTAQANCKAKMIFAQYGTPQNHDVQQYVIQ